MPRVLCKLSRTGNFPPIYSIGRCESVDEMLVERWLEERTQIMRTGSCNVPGYELP